MAKSTKIKNIGSCAELHRDPKSGIAWVKDYSTGMGHSCHANIDVTGSVRGMKKLGYWGKNDRTVKSHGFIYNIDTFVVDKKDPYDMMTCWPQNIVSAKHVLKEDQLRQRRIRL